MSKLSFLHQAGGLDDAASEAEPEALEAVSEPETQPRGPDGKFATKDQDQAPASAPEPEPEPAAVVTQPAPQPQTEAPMVPLPALLETRDKVKVLEQEVARLLQARDKPAPQPPPEPVEPPDPYEDPVGYHRFHEASIDQRLFVERLNISERFARNAHGDELVTAAQQWAAERGQTDQLFAQKLRQEADPYGYVVREYRRDQVFSSLADTDLDDFKAWKAAQAAANTTQQTPQPTPGLAPASPPPRPAPTPPPRSIAHAPSAGGQQAIPTGPGASYERAFRKG